MTSNEIYPKCGGKLLKREGKYGDFLSCSNFPKCRFSKDIDSKNSYGACPDCGSELIKKSNQYGPYLSCSSYPKCNYLKNLSLDDKKMEISIKPIPNIQSETRQVEY